MEWVKRFFSFIGRTLGYWIIWLALFSFIGPLIFPFSLWTEVDNILKIVVISFPIGFILRFISMYGKSMDKRFLYIVKDIVVILILVPLPNIAISMAYVRKNNMISYIPLIKGLIIVALGIVGYVIINKKINDNEKQKRIATKN